MAATYDPTHINDSNADYVSVVRFLIADTDTTCAELSDVEIMALYTNTSASDAQAIRNYQTALAAAQYLHTKYAKQATFSSAGTSVNLSERAKYWASVVQDLAYRVSAVMGSNGVTYVWRPASY